MSRDRYFIQKLLYTSKDVEWKNQFFQMQCRNEEQDICKESDNKCNEQLEYNTAVDKILKAGESFDEEPIHLFPILRTNMIVFIFVFVDVVSTDQFFMCLTQVIVLVSSHEFLKITYFHQFLVGRFYERYTILQ